MTIDLVLNNCEIGNSWRENWYN